MEQLQVLIVDEEDSKAEPLRVLMENNGFLADKETDPRRVRTRVRQSNYDIILLDIVMPDYNGIDVLVDVKTFSPSSKIIMMTGFATRTQIAEAMRLGASAFIERDPSVSSQVYIDKVKEVIVSPLVQEQSALREALIQYLWNRLKRGEGQQKGRDLEALTKLVFESVDGFERVTINVVTGIPEEIDIVVENERDDWFWRGQGDLIFIECKDWSKKRAGKNEYGVFYRKLEKSRRRSRLGFFISTSGFAKSFNQEALTTASEEIMIVPIGPADLKRLVRARDREPILKERVIATIHSRH